MDNFFNESSVKPKIALDEINLIDYPLSVFGPYVHRPVDKRDSRRVPILVYNKNLHKPISGYIKIHFLQSPETTSLLPHDEDLIIALSELTAKQTIDSPEIEFKSLNTIFKALGWNREGNNYRRIIDSFKRLRGITIETNVYYDKASKTYGYQIFGILSAVFISKISIDNVKPDTLHKTTGVRIIWDPVIWKSFKDGNYRYLNTNMYRSIKMAGARKLYRVIDKRLYKKTSVQFPVLYLGRNILNLDDKRTASYYKRFISKYGDELIRCRYITNYIFERKDDIPVVTFFESPPNTRTYDLVQV